METYTESYNVIVSHSVTKKDTSIERRSPFYFATKRLQSTPSGNDSSLIVNFTRNSPSSIAPPWKTSSPKLGSRSDGKKMNSITIVAHPTTIAVRNGILRDPSNHPTNKSLPIPPSLTPRLGEHLFGTTDVPFTSKYPSLSSNLKLRLTVPVS